MNSRKREGELTKQRIAEKAKELFIQKGYIATSMEEITTASETSKGNIYYHFKNKENLFLYILERDYEKWKDDWDAKKDSYPTVTEKLYGIAEHLAQDFSNPITKAAEEFSGTQLAKEDVFEKILEMSQHPYKVFRELLREGIREGEIREGNADDMADVFRAMMSGLGVVYYQKEMDELFRLYRYSVEVFLQGVAK
ncbi:TetR/AcrR family transcriptional regulator [Paenibacillus lutrae]|uniref:TetR family transcriptional regulator n=1 Tax=Paenibacillus lutrae TaxID=2078573 RepID=A0A7X3FHR5_9BACL|nr:TetR/AcrR family transcriptional regulator [Paenibacillus lutrae]MVO99837.1 TetR family transcriptional regulator [Paenibacillus lutrae]